MSEQRLDLRCFKKDPPESEIYREALRAPASEDALRERVRVLEEFVERIKAQTPECPDHWSSCGQCERNASDADDLMDTPSVAGRM